MATHDDFTAAKYRASVAMYCGSIPKVKPGSRPLRGRSIDSNLQLCGNGWMTADEASLHSVLKKQQACLWGGKGECLDISHLENWDSKKGLQKKKEDCTAMSNSSQLPRPRPKQDPSKLNMSSAAIETAQIKDKLKKRRLSEGILASNKGLLDSSGSKGLALKPALSRSASQRLLITSKPMPPIQSIPTSPELNGADEREQKVLENRKVYLEVGGDLEPTAATEQIYSGASSQDSPKPYYCPLPVKSRTIQRGCNLDWNLAPLHCCLKGPDKGVQIPHGQDENLRKSLGAALIPPIPKSAKACKENSKNFQEPLPSSSQLEPAPNAAMESHQLRLRPEPSHGEETTIQTLETRTSESAFENGLSSVLKVGGCPSLLPFTDPSLSLIKEGGQLSSPHLVKDDEWNESNGRIHVTISKSAQEKMRQKQLKEIEHLRKEREREKEREKEKSMIFQGQLQGTTQEGPGPINVNGAPPITLNLSNHCRTPVGMSLKKRINRPSLPSIPVINHDNSFLRHASANSLPAKLLDSPEWEEDLVNRDILEIRPLSHPEQSLVDALRCLNSSDWQLKEKGLFSIRCLATCHSEVLLCRLHDVSLAATKEAKRPNPNQLFCVNAAVPTQCTLRSVRVNYHRGLKVSNLRSKVSRFAIGTLAELFKTMKKNMDQEVEEISRVLLQKAGDSSEFIQKAADQSLGVMARSVTPNRALAALMANGANHRNPLVRKCAAGHLLTTVELIRPEKLLSGNRENTDLLVQTLVKLAQDCNQDTRFYGRKMLNILMSHSKFDGYLRQCLPSHDLRDVMAAIKQKGAEDQTSQALSAKSHQSSKNSSLTTSSDSLPSDEVSSSIFSDALALPQPGARRSSFRSIEVTEQLRELNKLLMAKEFQIRMEGVALLMEHCNNSPLLVSTNIIQIFDAFTPRLQDSNKKVNQYALQSVASMIPILKDGLNPVMVSVVTVVTDNLNSKNFGIYSAAVKVLDTMIIHLDNLLLLQTFASRVRFISGRALQDVTERLSVLVAVVHPRKSQAVERHVLPILWYFLSNMIGNGVLPGKSGNVRTVVSKLAKNLHHQMGSRLKEYASSHPQHVTKMLQDLLDNGPLVKEIQ